MTGPVFRPVFHLKTMDAFVMANTGQRLMVPAGMCESAITYGWPQSSKKIRSIHHVKIIKTKIIGFS